MLFHYSPLLLKKEFTQSWWRQPLYVSIALIILLSRSQLDRNTLFSVSKTTTKNNVYRSKLVENASRKSLKLLSCFHHNDNTPRPYPTASTVLYSVRHICYVCIFCLYRHNRWITAYCLYIKTVLCLCPYTAK